MPDWVLKLFGKFIGSKLKLEDGTVPTKPWYQSKGIWSDVITVGISMAALVDKDFGTHITTNHIYQILMTVLAGIGIYSRATATTTITP